MGILVIHSRNRRDFGTNRYRLEQFTGIIFKGGKIKAGMQTDKTK